MYMYVHVISLIMGKATETDGVLAYDIYNMQHCTDTYMHLIHSSNLYIPSMMISTCIFQELYDSLEKLRPKLFRLASETDENDTEGMSKLA